MRQPGNAGTWGMGVGDESEVLHSDDREEDPQPHTDDVIPKDRKTFW